MIGNAGWWFSRHPFYGQVQVKIGKGLWLEVLRLTCSPPPHHFSDSPTHGWWGLCWVFPFKSGDCLYKVCWSRHSMDLHSWYTRFNFSRSFKLTSWECSSCLAELDKGMVEKVSRGQLGHLLKRGSLPKRLDEACPCQDWCCKCEIWLCELNDGITLHSPCVHLYRFLNAGFTFLVY